MRSSGQTETQKWEDVDCYTENITCHVCNGAEKVKTGKIPDRIVDFSVHEVVFVGVTFWQLCEKCHFNGWKPPPSRFMGKLSYFKILGGHVKVLTV